MASRANSFEERVLVLLPTARDAQRTVELLSEVHVRAFACNDISHVCQELRLGASAVLVTHEALIGDTSGQLAEAMREQPSWSAVPFVVLAREGAGQLFENSTTDLLTNAIVVERPVRTRTLISVVLSALRGRRHQYEIRDAIRLREQQAIELHQSQLELARQADQLRAADARKDEFLATLAHELRNPLAPIRTGLDLLSLQPQPASGSTLAVMQRQLGHMVRLIDDLLDVSRITQGKLELKREVVSLRNVVDAAIEASRPSIDEGGHSLRVSLPDEPVWLDADFTRIAQVISNLLNNSSKYTARGGSIELTVSRQGAFVAIAVRDNGIGIPKEHFDDVFAMFNQVNRSFERSKGGLGIGLALVRRLVEMHGGTATAWSEGPGKGSTFTITLPQLAQAQAAPAEPNDVASSTAESRLVLVVDDNEDAAEMLSTMLALSGHRTRTANDGLQAIAAAQALVPQAIILDIGMPGMNGYDVARRLREDARFAHTALIALTGWGSQEDKLKAKDAGFDFHLTKPVNARDMQSVLSQVSERFLGAGSSPR